MPSRKRSFTQVPFNANGDLLTYTPHATDFTPPVERYRDERAWRDYCVRWQPADDFDAVLTLQGFHRGRSAAHLLLTDPDGHEFTMFLKDFVEAVKHGVRVGGEIAGKFEFVKRGQNFGISLLESAAMDVKPLDEDGVSPLSMTPEQFREWDAEARKIEATHSWLYGHNFVRCTMCGASAATPEARQPCPHFVNRGSW